jgi:predicted aspartyl protease
MIHGTFGVEDALLFEIELIASDGSGLEIEAMFDSGFSAWLAVNDQDIDGFGWIFIDQENMITAQGNSFFDIYLGKIKLDGTEYDIPVHVGKNLTEVLLGRQWLETKQLLVNKPQGILTLG